LFDLSIYYYFKNGNTAGATECGRETILEGREGITKGGCSSGESPYSVTFFDCREYF